MQVNHLEYGLEIILFHAEASIVQDILKRILHNYQIPPQEHHDSVQAVWYPNAIEESYDYDDGYALKSLHSDLQEYRSQNADLVKKWISCFDRKDEPVLWLVKEEDIDSLLTVINDHRLYLAADNKLTEEELEQHLEEIEDPKLRSNLIEIHFLAWLIELILSNR
ncbi:MAG: DUF2017 family protein [Verrucomicrobiota bacterium]